MTRRVLALPRLFCGFPGEAGEGHLDFHKHRIPLHFEKGNVTCGFSFISAQWLNHTFPHPSPHNFAHSDTSPWNAEADSSLVPYVPMDARFTCAIEAALRLPLA